MFHIQINTIIDRCAFSHCSKPRRCFQIARSRFSCLRHLSDGWFWYIYIFIYGRRSHTSIQFNQTNIIKKNYYYYDMPIEKMLFKLFCLLSTPHITHSHQFETGKLSLKWDVVTKIETCKKTIWGFVSITQKLTFVSTGFLFIRV